MLSTDIYTCIYGTDAPTETVISHTMVYIAAANESIEDISFETTLNKLLENGYIKKGIHTIRDKVVKKYLSTAEYSLVWNKNLVMYSVISEGGGFSGHNYDNFSAFG